MQYVALQWPLHWKVLMSSKFGHLQITLIWIGHLLAYYTKIHYTADSMWNRMNNNLYTY